MHQEFEIEYTYRGKYKKTTIVADTKSQALDCEVISVQGKIYTPLY